jgi:hypothetical protein
MGVPVPHKIIWYEMMIAPAAIVNQQIRSEWEPFVPKRQGVRAVSKRDLRFPASIEGVALSAAWTRQRL